MEKTHAFLLLFAIVDFELSSVVSFSCLVVCHCPLLFANEIWILCQYVDQSVTLKACAGLNGMKLGGRVLTAVQAIHGASSLVQVSPSSFSDDVHYPFLLFYLDMFIDGRIKLMLGK